MIQLFRKLLRLFSYYLLPSLLLIIGFYMYKTSTTGDLEHWAAELGEKAWVLFIITLYVSPLSVLVPERFAMPFHFVVSLRRELGILITWMVFCHTLFLILPVTDFSRLGQDLLDPKSTWSWGAVAGVAVFIMGITSNRFSDKVLKQLWQKIHYLAYAVLLTGMLHVAIYREDFTEFYTVFPLYFLLKGLAYRKRRTARLLKPANAT